MRHNDAAVTAASEQSDVPALQRYCGLPPQATGPITDPYTSVSSATYNDQVTRERPSYEQRSNGLQRCSDLGEGNRTLTAGDRNLT